jgi:hypothetical protein
MDDPGSSICVGCGDNLIALGRRCAGRANVRSTTSAPLAQNTAVPCVAFGEPRHGVRRSLPAARKGIRTALGRCALSTGGIPFSAAPIPLPG